MNQRDRNLSEHQSTGDSVPLGGGFSRRTVIRGAAYGTLATGGAVLLGACGSSSSSTAVPGSKGTKSDPEKPIASKNNPVELPMSKKNPAIPSGRSPESGPLEIYTWADYLSPAVTKSFSEKYGVKVNVTTYSTTDESIKKLSSGALRADAWVGDPGRMLQLVGAQVIQPINHDYIPNLDNVIPAAGDPFYDKGARYSTPNFINLWGIAWRNDLVDIQPSSRKSPYSSFWDAPPETVIGLINSSVGPAFFMAMVANQGITDFDGIREKDVKSALKDLQEIKHLKLQYGAFQPLADGTVPLAYAFNGDMVVIPSYLPNKAALSTISYYQPTGGKTGLILNDQWLIPKNSQHPVLGHLFLNHFLEMESAVSNFRDVGYQTMLKDLTIDHLVNENVAPQHAIEMAFATPEMQSEGLPGPVLNATQLHWFDDAYSTLSKG